MISEVFLQDCMEGMKTYPDKYFDLAVVDPPFGIGNFVQNTGTIRGDAVTWNDKTPNEEYFNELKRVSKHRIIFGANYYNCFEGKSGAIVWVKNQPMPNFSKCVIASCTHHKKIELYTQTWTNFVNDRDTDHPCEMPKDIYSWIYKNYLPEGGKVIDTHLGSGSNRIAADKAGNIDFTGYEIDKDYYEAQEKRWKNYKAQLTMFA